MNHDRGTAMGRDGLKPSSMAPKNVLISSRSVRQDQRAEDSDLNLGARRAEKRSSIADL